MNIEPIIYQTTRGIYSVEDKLSIATLILFCWKLSSKTFSELLYGNNHYNFIKELSNKYSDYGIDLSIRLSDKNVSDAFYNTIKEVIVKYDADGYLKALYNKDEFALAIEGIVNYNFDKVEFVNFQKNMGKQLEIMF